MTDETDDIAQEATDLANGLEGLFAGHRTSAALYAMAMVTAAIALDCNKPGAVNELLRTFDQSVRDEFARKLRERQH